MKTIRFGSIAEFRNGVNYDADGAEVRAKVIGVGDFGSLSRLSTFSHISEIRLSAPLSDQDCLVDGDLLFVRSNGSKKLVGRCMLIETPPALMTHSGFTIRARVDSQKYLPAFVAAIFQTEAIHKQAHLEGTGTNISNLSQQILSGIRLPSFTIHEQLEYLQRVGVWDSASDKSTALLALLEQRKQGLMQQLMTGRRRLKGFRGKWKTVSVGSFAANASNINKSGHALPVLSCTKYAGLVDSLSYFGKQIFSVNTNTYKLVARGQFAYATNHIEEGSIGYQSLYDAALISPMYTVFEVDAAAVDHGFLYKLLKTEAMRRVFESSTHGSVARRGSLRWPEFAKLKIAVPPLPEQTAIATLLDVASKEIELVSAEIAQLRTQKRALMQKLLSGAWRLPEAPLPQGVSA